MSSTKKRLVACPTCREFIEYSMDNKFRPFCSERCKLIDLGLWANEEFKIASPITLEAFDEEFPDAR
jgi:endogenous inhibitor of DNA gyrase (YacG/DUF329 family)